MNLPIILINLSESKARLEHSQQEFAKAGLTFERLEAVDGRKMSKEELDKITQWDKSAFFKPLSPGEVGCYLSHIAAAEKIVCENWPYTLVFEDDFRLTPQFSEVVLKTIKSAPDSFHIIKLQGNVQGKEVIADINSNHKIIRHRRISSQTVAQLWSLEGAKMFLKIARPLRRPVDVQLKYWWEGPLNIFQICPPVVLDGDALGVTSTIGARKPKGIMHRLRRVLYRLKFSLNEHLKYLKHYGLRSWVRSIF